MKEIPFALVKMIENKHDVHYNLRSTAVFTALNQSVHQTLRVTLLAFLCVFVSFVTEQKNKMHDTETARFVLLRDDKHVKTLHRQTRGL